MVGRDEIVVVINTGSGLKDVRAATQITTGMRVIAPTLAAVKEALDPALTALYDTCRLGGAEHNVLCDLREGVVGAVVGGGSIKAEKLVGGEGGNPRVDQAVEQRQVFQAGNLQGAAACPVATLRQRIRRH